MTTFNILIEQDEDGILVSEVVELPGCHTQARNMPDLLKRTREAIILYLRCMKDEAIKEKFLGVQQISI